MMNTLLHGLGWLLQHVGGKTAIVAACIALPWMAGQVKPQDYEPALGFGSEAQGESSTNAVQRLFGEVRTSLSDYMFLKTERYLHSGVGYAPHGADYPTAQEEDHDDTMTLIRPPAYDWRGIIGDIQREVTPWMDPSRHVTHTAGTQLLPWYRMLTLINPHRIRGYRIGAMWLLAENDKSLLDEALAFVDEGIGHNPNAHELYAMRSRILLRQDKQLEALDALRLGVERGAMLRPQGGWSLDGANREKENAFVGAVRMEIFLLDRLDRREEALIRAREGIALLDGDPVLQETLEQWESEL